MILVWEIINLLMEFYLPAIILGGVITAVLSVLLYKFFSKMLQMFS